MVIFMEMVKKAGKLVPGFAVALVIAALAKFIESLLPIHLIGASVIALFIGMIINHFWKPAELFTSGLQFTSKKILKATPHNAANKFSQIKLNA